jgi:hypothetical protein
LTGVGDALGFEVRECWESSGQGGEGGEDDAEECQYSRCHVDYS